VLSVLSLGLACVLTGPAHAELFKWVDENGKTHYGDQVPERYQQKQQSLKVDKAPSQDERNAALLRIQKEKNAANAMKAQRDARSELAGRPAKSAPAGPANETACQKEWRVFLDSKTCFQPFRTANGGIRAEAYQHCKEMPEPRSICPP
jgi:FtsZ-interacting cell division protein YlmF